MFTDLEKRWKAIVLFLGTALLVSHANGGDDIKTFTRDHLTDLAVKSANNWYPKGSVFQVLERKFLYRLYDRSVHG